MLPLWIIDITRSGERHDTFVGMLAAIGHVHTPQHPDDNNHNGYTDTLRGNYWWYTQVDDNLSEQEGEDPKRTAQRLYELQSALVKEGQTFIQHLRESNVKPYQTISVIVLGDANERFSRQVFPSIAAILQKEKGRMLPHHIHQGIEIFGMLFLAANTNTLPVEARRDVKRMLDEIEVQHDITSIRGYDHMILWQDVQNRTENLYPRLNAKQQAEYMLQCIVHLFFACDLSHPVLSGTGAADTFYLSMGVASLFFDITYEDMLLRNELERNVLNAFKSEGAEEKYNPHLELISKDEYSPLHLHVLNNLAEFFNQTTITLDVGEPRPHPVHDMTSRRLLRDFYNGWLRFFPARLMNSIVSQVEERTNPALTHIAADSQRTYRDAQRHIRDNIDRTLSQLTVNDGGLPVLKYLCRDMQEKLANNRKDIARALETCFWRPLYDALIPDGMQEDFMTYHDAYRDDMRNKSTHKQSQLRNEAINDLRRELSTTGTALSHIARVFLLDLLLVLTTWPLFNFLAKHPVWWMLLICIIPIAIKLGLWLQARQTRQFAIRRLHAYYLHEAYARIANRIDNELNGLYDKLMQLSNEYRERCEQIIKQVHIPPLPRTGKMEIPPSLFNQPLSGGTFDGKTVLPADELKDSLVRVNYSPHRYTELEPTHFFMLINQFHTDMLELFDDVYLTSNFIKERDEQTGEERLVSKAEQEERKQAKWQEHIERFKHHLSDDIASIMVPREYASVGEKLCEYNRFTGNSDILSNMLAMAASNSELTSSADTEYADIKTNKNEIRPLAAPYLPVQNTKYQIEPYDSLYKKYMFVTRWRSYEHLPYNRLLPTEDFDTGVRAQRVTNTSAKSDNYIPHISSLLLWALCPDDTSSVWLRLFEAEHFAKAYSERTIYREILNQDD